MNLALPEREAYCQAMKVARRRLWLVFERVPTPTQQEVESLVLDVHARVMRLLDKHGLLQVGADDALAQDAPALSACYEGAVTQHVGLGPMKGRPVMKLGMSLSRHLASAGERVERAGPLSACCTDP